MLHDRARAWSGVNLYTNDRDRAYLMDMDGRRLHTWRLPATDQQHCEHAELLDDRKIAVVCVNDALFVLDARSNIVLEHRAKVHHDIAPLADGGMLVPEKSIHFYRRRMVYFDGLTWLSPKAGRGGDGRPGTRAIDWRSSIHRRRSIDRVALASSSPAATTTTTSTPSSRCPRPRSASATRGFAPAISWCACATRGSC